jgi:hypothetical protein
MSKIACCFGCLLALVPLAQAQVSVEVVLDQDQFLPGETLIAAVRVTNRSGQTLPLGETADWLSLFVEAKDGFVVDKVSDVPVISPFELESSKVAIKRVNLAPYYRLTKTGRYSIRATVRIKHWTQEFTSPPKAFDIITGAKLWDQEFGVPRPGGQPEVRKYLLQQANYLKQLRLYARVTDADGGRFFGVIALGPMVSFGRPEAQIDKQSDLHTLFQTGPRNYAYCVVSPDGTLKVRHNYQIATNRPKLAVDEQGDVSVLGGTRMASAEDLPPEPPPEPAPELPAPKP